MSSILKFFRIAFFLVLYFFLCMVVVTTMLQGWPVGGQMLFAFGVPCLLYTSPSPRDLSTSRMPSSA